MQDDRDGGCGVTWGCEQEKYRWEQAGKEQGDDAQFLGVLAAYFVGHFLEQIVFAGMWAFE